MFRKIIFLCLITLLFSALSAVKAQEVIDETPSMALTTIKFTQLTGGVILFVAHIDTASKSYQFILDTGSSGISLDSTTAAESGFNVSPPSIRIKGVGGFVDVGFVRNKSLWIKELKTDSLNFHVIDYAMLTAKYGVKIDGIVGYSVFSKYIVKINYDDTTITFCSNGTIKYPRGGMIIYPQLGKLPISTANVTDAVSKKLNYIFDIGAGLTVLFSDEYIKDSALLKSKRKKYIKKAEGLGGTIDMQVTIMKSLKIGSYKFKNIPIQIFTDSVNITNYPIMGGIIGNEILRRLNLIVNYDKKQIYIKPNKSFNDPFDYAYSGLEIYYWQNKILVGEVPENSPAAKAGVKMGDEIIGINKTLGVPLNQLKEVLQNNLGLISLIIIRDGELLNLKMKVIDIRTGGHNANVIQPRQEIKKHPLNFETGVW